MNEFVSTLSSSIESPCDSCCCSKVRKDRPNKGAALTDYRWNDYPLASLFRLVLASARYTSESSHTCVQLGRLYTRVLCSGILCLRNFQRDQNRKIIHLFGKGSSKIKRFLFSERLNIDTGFNGSRTSFFAKAKSSWVSIIDGVENVIKKREREREKVLDISRRTIHFSIFSFVNFSGYVLSSPSIDPFTWPSARSNFSLDAKKV